MPLGPSSGGDVYCPMCVLERGCHALFCNSCGAHLRRRLAVELREALSRATIVITEVRRWVREARLPASQAAELLAPTLAQRELLRIELGLDPAPARPA